MITLNTRGKRMTRAIKLLLVFALVLLIVLFPIAILYFINFFQLEKAQSDLNWYYARKEELLLEQQRLENMISQLNKTLAANIQKNEKLAKELSNITNSQNVVISLPPEPVVQSTPPKVTRAS
jgi:hypothetical protein